MKNINSVVQRLASGEKLDVAAILEADARTIEEHLARTPPEIAKAAPADAQRALAQLQNEINSCRGVMKQCLAEQAAGNCAVQ
mmetsp:Transcript_9552/g.26774  ORF Transcript_9552/g.26774 Transcript_9552/m.26774 type:complete len:83 (-) Transcript_9552:1523-1771(-)